MPFQQTEQLLLEPLTQPFLPFMVHTVPFVAFGHMRTHPVLHLLQPGFDSWSQLACMALFKMLSDQINCICSTAPVQCNASPTVAVVVYYR